MGGTHTEAIVAEHRVRWMRIMAIRELGPEGLRASQESELGTLSPQQRYQLRRRIGSPDGSWGYGRVVVPRKPKGGAT
jgi:hypothetical protein